MRVALVLAVAALSCTDGSIVESPDDEEPAIPDPADDDPTAPGAQPLQITAGCTAKADLAGHPAWFFFVRPDKPCTGAPGSGIDRHAINELVRLIRSVPPGGRIDGHIFSITVDAVGKALLDAQSSGVDVRISTDGQVATVDDSVRTEYLEKLNDIVFCKSANNRACVSTATDAISHTKAFVFSRATAPDDVAADNVVWLGSANQTYASGMRLYNNTVTIYGDQSLYGQMRDYLDDLHAKKRHADYYDPDSGRGHMLAASADVYVSPESQTDLVVNRLDDITATDSCRVRVMQASIRDSRLDVVKRLVAMKRNGCKVYVVAHDVEPDALRALRAANISVRQMPIHDKTFIVYAKYGAQYEYRVYTGSHNLSGGAGHKYDEIFVKLAAERDATHPVYDAYVTHFNDAYDGAPAL